MSVKENITKKVLPVLIITTSSILSLITIYYCVRTSLYKDLGFTYSNIALWIFAIIAVLVIAFAQIKMFRSRNSLIFAIINIFLCLFVATGMYNLVHLDDHTWLIT